MLGFAGCDSWPSWAGGWAAGKWANQAHAAPRERKRGGEVGWAEREKETGPCGKEIEKKKGGRGRKGYLGQKGCCGPTTRKYHFFF